jgi:hypothetical protein
MIALARNAVLHDPTVQPRDVTTAPHVTTTIT